MFFLVRPFYVSALLLPHITTADLDEVACGRERPETRDALLYSLFPTSDPSLRVEELRDVLVQSMVNHSRSVARTKLLMSGRHTHRMKRQLSQLLCPHSHHDCLDSITKDRDGLQGEGHG